MEFNIDQTIYWQWEFVRLNATLLYTWMVMLILILGAWAVTSRMDPKTSISRWQHLLEAGITVIQEQIREASRQEPGRYLPFIGTLFLFILTSNVLDVVPGFTAPTTSLSTTAALAFSVFVAVPVFGISRQGWKNYLGQYIKPTPFMLPFNLMGEITRTFALAIRLFGNIMSGSMVVAILLSLTPLFFPVVMQAFGLLIGIVQAYVFAILALVYIASGERTQPPYEKREITTVHQTVTQTENMKEE